MDGKKVTKLMGCSKYQQEVFYYIYRESGRMQEEALCKEWKLNFEKRR